MIAARVLPYGPQAVLIECAPATAVSLGQALQRTSQFREVVPAECSVLVMLPEGMRATDVELVLRNLPPLLPAPEGRDVVIPVTYDGVDLELVATAARISVDEVISLHSNATYFAAFSGFAPGFVYLTGLPSALHLPRRPSPRTRVPARSVAIADAYSAVYPQPSPGGWHLIGSTDLTLFDLAKTDPALIRPGDRVRFTVRTS